MKIRCALIGPGNVGLDLLHKLLRSDTLEPLWVAGIQPDSAGLVHAQGLGLETTHTGVDGLLPHIDEDNIRIAFDATSARIHPENSRKLTARGVKVIDMTPAAIGPLCVPAVNLEEYIGRDEMNVNMVTCGGQATIPMVYAINRVQNVRYSEIIATVSSKSVGPGTRKNVDEFIQTTAAALEKIGGAHKGKTMIIINPSEPPLIMRDTIHCITEKEPQCDAIIESVRAMEKSVQEYVPGYRIKEGPIFDGNRISIFIEVRGHGDYLPEYAGNLDIMTAAAARTAEMFAQHMLQEPGV
ncbi:MAG: acetaldehyde dehydrogenase (acetylating) [Thiolinea sp.]